MPSGAAFTCADQWVVEPIFVIQQVDGRLSRLRAQEALVDWVIRIAYDACDASVRASDDGAAASVTHPAHGLEGLGLGVATRDR